MIDMLLVTRSRPSTVWWHAVLILHYDATDLFKHYTVPPDFAADPGGLVSNEPVVERPPEDQPQLQKPDFSQAPAEVSNVATAPSTIAAVTTNNLTTPNFNMSSLASTMPAMKSDVLKTTQAPKVPTTGTGLTPSIAKGI